MSVTIGVGKMPTFRGAEHEWDKPYITMEEAKEKKDRRIKRFIAQRNSLPVLMNVPIIDAEFTEVTQ